MAAASCASQAPRRRWRRHRVADALRGVAARREELGVVERRPRAAPRPASRSLLELRRQVDRGDGSPARIARAAAPRSSPRFTIAIPGAAATVCTNRRDVAELSMSTTTTPRPRTTAALKVSQAARMRSPARRTAGSARRGSRRIQRTSRADDREQSRHAGGSRARSDQSV